MHPIIVSGSNPIFQQGNHLAFFGRSNVGKSSTINALLNNKSAAKTSRTPGKTITFNFYDISNDETDLRYLVDLPGYGYARHGESFREKLRRRLIWYLSDSGATIDNFCLVLDAKAGITEVDEGALDLAKQHGIPVVLLVNKVDRLNQKDRSALRRTLSAYLEENGLEFPVVYYSAKTKKGVAELRNILHINTLAN